MTGSAKSFIRLSETNVGDVLSFDAGFDCGIAGKTLVVDEDDHGLFVACDEGRHYLDGQLADDGDHLVGVYRVEGETVEVWSTQTPSLNGTSMVVSTTPDSFELVVADLLPDDDDGDEEPGAMCKRALAKAEASVDRRRQITKWALKEVVGVRGFGIEQGANGLWHVLLQDGSLAFTLSEDVLPDQPGAAKKVVGALYTAWMNGVQGQRARTATEAPETITLTREALTSALREAAAQGMDRTSGPSCEEAASCRDVADEIVEAIEAGRFSADDYGYRVESERRVS